MPGSLHQLQHTLGNDPGDVGGGRGGLLPLDGLKLWAAQGHLHGGALHLVPPQPQGHPLRQEINPCPQFLLPHQVPAEGEAIAHGLGGRHLPRRADWAAVLPGGVVVDLPPMFSQQPLHLVPGGRGQVSNGADARLLQHPGRGPAHKEQIGHRQGPDDPGHVLPPDDCGGIGLFVVTAQFGKHSY